MEIPFEETGGSLQTWNLHYFGFYPGFVTLFSKDEGDLKGSSVAIVGSNFKTKKIPNIHVIQGHHRDHQCYQEGKQRSAIAETWFEETGDITDEKEVTHVVYNSEDGKAGVLY